MKLMGATWRRSGLSKAAMRAYYNDIHGPIVAKDPAEIICYVQNVVEDAVFYCKDAHVPITPPDGLTELFHVDQEALLRTFGTPYYAEVAWPDTLVYADLTRAVSVAGDERPVLSSSADKSAFRKVMSFVLVPSGTDTRLAGFWDSLADILRSQEPEKAGVIACDLVTEFEHPNEGIRKLFERPGPRAVAGITMFLESGVSWEMSRIGEAIVEAMSEAFGAEAFVLMMLVTPNIVIERTGDN
jgi:hypothetical protein